MKFGIRTPSIKKRIAARTSVKRYVRHNLGVKAPRGAGIITNPKKAVYNRVYNRTTMSVDDFITPQKTNIKSNKQVSNENSNIFPVFFNFHRNRHNSCWNHDVIELLEFYLYFLYKKVRVN